jgi:hypothetical protein
VTRRPSAACAVSLSGKTVSGGLLDVAAALSSVK